MGTFGQPVERDGVEDGVERRVGVCPVEELFADPVVVNWFLSHWLEREREAYQASKARGFELNTNPMVLGLVACSIAYAVPVAFQSCHRLRPAFSVAESSPLVSTGSETPQKLRWTPLNLVSV